MPTPPRPWDLGVAGSSPDSRRTRIRGRILATACCSSSRSRPRRSRAHGMLTPGSRRDYCSRHSPACLRPRGPAGRRVPDLERRGTDMSISQLQMRFRAVVRTLLGPALWAAAFASGIGCAVKAPTHKFDSRHQAAEDIKANANQARLKMRSLVDPMCGQIERSADQIADSTSDPAVRRMAVQWKIEAVPALREALFEPNPFIALADSWVLFDQMADFFETGAGRAALGDWATSAVETCRRLEEEMAQVAASMTH